jgi:carbohydrate-binding DOMON domain-containing protein
MKEYNKDELRLKNAKLKMVNDLLDQSIEEQKTSEKSKKIKKAVLEIKRFWSEDVKKEAHTKAENSIGVKVKALQDKQILLQHQQKKAEEMFEIEQIWIYIKPPSNNFTVWRDNFNDSYNTTIPQGQAQQMGMLP